MTLILSVDTTDYEFLSRICVDQSTSDSFEFLPIKFKSSTEDPIIAQASHWPIWFTLWFKKLLDAQIDLT